MTLHAITSSGWADASPATDAAPAVALFLHGFGSHERDLIALAPALPAGVPWASLRAPLEVQPQRFAWFHITRPGNPDPAVVAEATDAIWEWADAALSPETRIVPIGFSQGGLMASQLLRTAPDRVLAPVILGGFVQAAPQPGDARLRDTRPAVFSGRGADDHVIAAAAVERTDAWLPTHSTPTDRRYPGLGHGIDSREFADVRDFLAEQLAAVDR
ncbi:alpha/beta hydrolase [Agromyces sp. SYSU T00266]|uniref:alpha/beta hydrolase n=1 Tax=Agromyces zhanjiangensis TaxID=3158562 RepID=UPI0033979E83